MNNVKPPAKYRPGDVVTLKAVRASEMGVFLDAGTGNTDDDILLHKLQQHDAEVKIGDSVKVYLYLDPHGRLTASMKLPKMREGQLGYVKVLSVTRDGGFVDIGAERGVFLPYSQMRGHVSPGQLVWVKLYRDKTGRQAVSMRVEKEMQKASRPASGIKVGDSVTGTVYNILPEGFFIFTTQRFLGLLRPGNYSPRGLYTRGRQAEPFHAPAEGACHGSRRRRYFKLFEKTRRQNALLRRYADGSHQGKIRHQQGGVQTRAGQASASGPYPSGGRLDDTFG